MTDFNDIFDDYSEKIDTKFMNFIHPLMSLDIYLNPFKDHWIFTSKVTFICNVIHGVFFSLFGLISAVMAYSAFISFRVVEVTGNHWTVFEHDSYLLLCILGGLVWCYLTIAMYIITLPFYGRLSYYDAYKNQKLRIYQHKKVRAIVIGNIKKGSVLYVRIVAIPFSIFMIESLTTWVLSTYA